MRLLKPVEGVFENIDYKTFRKEDLKQISVRLREEADGLADASPDLSFMIFFDDDSLKIQDSPEVFEGIKKPMKAVWMLLRTEDGAHQVDLRLNATTGERSDSYLAINAPNLNWVFAVQGKLKDVMKELDNKTQWIYQPAGWVGFLSLLFNLCVVILFSYSLFLFFNSVLRMPQIFSIVLFVVIVQLLLYVVPWVTTTRFRTFLVELRPRIELVADQTRMEREKKSTWWAVLKHFVVPLGISLLVAFLSFRLFQ